MITKDDMTDSIVTSALCLRAVQAYADDLHEATQVGMLLAGDKATHDRLSDLFFAGMLDPWEWKNPVLLSLLQALLHWREHSDANTLPAYIPYVNFSHLPTVVDCLLSLGMWGEGTEYEQPTQAQGTFPGHVWRLPGWTTNRLCELYALGYVALGVTVDDVDDCCLWLGSWLADEYDITFAQLLSDYRAMEATGEAGESCAVLVRSLTRLLASGAVSKPVVRGKVSFWRAATIEGGEK